MDERDWPEELDRLIEAVASADEPYQAALAVTACADEFLPSSAVASGVYLIWQALQDRYELRPESEDDRTFAAMRRAAAEWAAVKDDATARAEYLDRWQYEELGYERLVPKGWKLQIQERPDGSFQAEAKSPGGKAVHATAPSWFQARDEVRRMSFAALER
ncbi:MAG: hypothetical protein JHC84_03535 [Solirubrobacteraceae bacterium]|nr:hypothetical protein [Solirubrobacteraceae bacterium]